jgi:hypothetical protein
MYMNTWQMPLQLDVHCISQVEICVTYQRTSWGLCRPAQLSTYMAEFLSTGAGCVK